jgi:hypothetical protein
MMPTSPRLVAADTSRTRREHPRRQETRNCSGFSWRISDERALGLLSRSLLLLHRLSLSETGQVPERRRAVLGLEEGDDGAQSARHGEERISNRRTGHKQNEQMRDIRAEYNRRSRHPFTRGDVARHAVLVVNAVLVKKKA